MSFRCNSTRGRVTPRDFRGNNRKPWGTNSTRNNNEKKPVAEKKPPPRQEVVTFLDHASINFNAMKASGRLNGFPEGVDDVCVRIIPAKVFDYVKDVHLVEGGDMEKLFCYTSDPTVATFKNIGTRNIVARVFPKSNWNNRDRIVDTYCVADAVETIFDVANKKKIAEMGSNDKGAPFLLCIWSANMDILQPVLEKARSVRMAVEVWTFKNTLQTLSNDFPEVKLRWLDEEILPKLTERKTGWKPNPEKVPPSNSNMQLRFKRGSKEFEVVKNDWRDILDILTSILKMPLQAWFKWDETFLYVILCVPPKMVENLMRKVVEMKEKLEMEVRQFIARKLETTHVNFIFSIPSLKELSSKMKKINYRRSNQADCALDADKPTEELVDQIVFEEEQPEAEDNEKPVEKRIDDILFDEEPEAEADNDNTDKPTEKIPFDKQPEADKPTEKILFDKQPEPEANKSIEKRIDDILFDEESEADENNVHMLDLTVEQLARKVQLMNCSFSSAFGPSVSGDRISVEGKGKATDRGSTSTLSMKK